MNNQSLDMSRPQPNHCPQERLGPILTGFMERKLCPA